jgi:hypothetical protein
MKNCDLGRKTISTSERRCKGLRGSAHLFVSGPELAIATIPRALNCEKVKSVERSNIVSADQRRCWEQ